MRRPVGADVDGGASWRRRRVVRLREVLLQPLGLVELLFTHRANEALKQRARVGEDTRRSERSETAWVVWGHLTCFRQRSKSPHFFCPHPRFSRSVDAKDSTQIGIEHFLPAVVLQATQQQIYTRECINEFCQTTMHIWRHARCL